jgi:hypothetical protein
MADFPEAFVNSLPSWPPELARLVPLFVRQSRTPPPDVLQPAQGPPKMRERGSSYPILRAAVLVNEEEAAILRRFIDHVSGRSPFRSPDSDHGGDMVVMVDSQRSHPSLTFDASANGYRAELCFRIAQEGASLRQ